MQDPSVTMSLSSSAQVYLQGETVPLTVTMTNRTKLTLPVTIQVRVSDPTNLSVFNTTLTAELAAGANHTEAVSVPLAADAVGGFYVVLAEAMDASGRKIGGATTSFEVPRYLLSAAVRAPNGWRAQTPLEFDLVNRGALTIDTATVSATLYDPSNVPVWTGQTSSPALGSGQQATVNLLA